MKLNLILMSLILTFSAQSWAGFGKTETEKFDILLMVDDSGSMYSYEANLDQFLSNILRNFAGKDVQLGLQTTSSLYQQSLVGSVALMGPTISGDFDTIVSHTQKMIGEFKFDGSANEMFFNSLVPILTGPENQGFMRQGAKLIILIISDEDDQSPESAKQVISDLLEYKKFDQIEVHAIHSQNRMHCSGSEVSTSKIQQLVDMTGGQSFDICSKYWSSYQIPL